MSDRIEKEIALKAPIARVWRALTDHREFCEWFRVKLDRPFVPGQITRGHSTYPGYEHKKVEIAVVAMEANTRFAYRWHPNPADPTVDYSNEPTTLVEFRLEAKGGGTLLRVTESGFDALPAHRRTETFRKNDGGWTEQMKNIAQHLGE